MVSHIPARLTVIAFLVLSFFPEHGNGQSSFLEWLLEHDTQFSDQSAALDYLEDLEKNPVPVNSATADDFLRIPGITPGQAHAVVAARAEKRAFTSLESVKKAGGIPDAWFAVIVRFLTLHPAAPRFSLDIRQRNQRSIEKVKAFENGVYAGSVMKNYSRYMLTAARGITSGLLVEKDPGERRFADHAVGFVRWRSDDSRIDLTGGYYSIDFGQGLLFSRYGFFGKSQEPVIPVMRRSGGVRGYRSSIENEGFRGAAASYAGRAAAVTVFAADTYRDARLNGDGYVTSVPASGYHRTETEISYHDRLNERVSGARLQYAPVRQVSIGATGASLSYNHPFAAEEPEKRLYSFSGSRLGLFSVDWAVNAPAVQLFGEIGFSQPGTRGLVTGILWNDASTRVGLLFRDYARDFYSPFGHSFADNTSEIRNERGFYFGIKHKHGKRLEMSFYGDMFEHPWRRYTLPVRSSGMELFCQARLPLRQRQYVLLNWKRRSSIERSTRDDVSGISRDYYRRAATDRVRLQAAVRLTSRCRVHARYEIQHRYAYDDSGAGFFNGLFQRPGTLVSSRITYDSERAVRMTGGCMLFSTRGRGFYQYEPDFPGLLTIKQLHGSGERFFILLTVNRAFMKFSCKYGITHYRNRDAIGSGSSSIPKNYKQEIGIQCDFAFNESSFRL